MRLQLSAYTLLILLSFAVMPTSAVPLETEDVTSDAEQEQSTEPAPQETDDAVDNAEQQQQSTEVAPQPDSVATESTEQAALPEQVESTDEADADTDNGDDTPDIFVPTLQISQDLGVSFPADI